MAKEKGLIGKFRAIRGDLIMLSSLGVEVTGYVVSQNKKEVKLSHEKPFSYSLFRKGRTSSTKGDRTYELKYFSDYKTLKHSSSYPSG